MSKLKESVFLILIILLVFTAGCSSKTDVLQNNNDETITLLPNTETVDAIITVEELSMHKYSSDCWIAYGVEVYDITPYIQKNPDTNLIEYCGTIGFETVLDSMNLDFSDIQEVSIYKKDLE